MKRAAVIALVASVLLGCATQIRVTVPEMTAETVLSLAEGAPSYPKTRFVVFSDPHIYDTDLGTTGAAFEKYLSEDRKLLVESTEILSSALQRVEEEDPDFVLVCGDLTKDGERISHELFAQHLADLEAGGTEVYVVPGNHDIANVHAVRYFGDEEEPVESVTSGEFRELYRNFGFSEAIASDPDSLSYVVEPVQGLWILALDSCRYREQEPRDEPVTDGMFYPATLAWLGEILERSVQEDKAVVGFLHHAVMEHHPGHEKHDGEYIIDGFEEIGRLFADYRVRVIFSGHDHAQDITMKRWSEGLFLYGVQTGSLVTTPSPYRVVSIGSDQMCDITSRFVDRIESHPVGFREFARNVALSGIETIAISRMVEDYSVSEKDARLIAPQVAAAYVAHWEGDESPTGEVLSTEGVGWWGRIIVSAQKEVITGRWQDLEPRDNDITINLATGEWQR
jgi:3',5'-cyclic AMP phosphodiesterase CpdA